MERFRMIASGYALFIRRGKILLSERKHTGYMDGWFSLPAGHIEEGETLTDGTLREIQEETGVILGREDVQLVHVMHRKSNDIRMDFFFLVSDTQGNPENTEPEKCACLQWFPIQALPNNTIPYIREAITHYTQKKFFSEFGWED